MYRSSFTIKSNCGLSTAAKEVGAAIVSVYVYPMSDGKNFVFSFTTSSDIDALRHYLSSDFLNYKIYRGKNVVFIQGIKQGHGMINSIISSGGVPLFPFVARGGTESFDFITYRRHLIDEVIDSVSKHNEIAFSSYDSLRNDDILSVLGRKNSVILTKDLTDIERRVIRKAYRSGYFSWPRDYRLDLMVSDFSLSKPTLLYHIRNAERKILSMIMDQN